MRRAGRPQWRTSFAVAIALAAIPSAALADEDPVVQLSDEVVEEFVPDDDEGFVIDLPAEPLVEIGPQPVPAAPAGGFLGLGLRAMFNAIAPQPQAVQQAIPADEAEDGEMPKDPAQAQLWQQRKQIRQQAKHLEQLFQPVLRTELEMVRQACPNLPADARREVLVAGKAAVTKTALEFATQQMLGGQPRRAFNARRGIQLPVAQTLERHASAEQFASYNREQASRMSRRAEAARVAIVAKLDRQLDLSAAQRRAIEGDLEARWEEAWLRELDDTGMVINNFRPAPDYANGCIEPHLDDAQRDEWVQWRKAAGMAVVGRHVGWNFDGQGLHQEDDWWTQGASP